MKHKPTSSEHAEQCALLKWAKLQSTRYPMLNSLFAIPNGGRRSSSARSVMKAEGCRPGVPDLCLPFPSSGFAALYIELKASGGKLSKEQMEWHTRLREAGNRVDVCYGWEEAKNSIVDYLGGN